MSYFVRYKVITASTEKDLSLQVTAEMAEGEWQPFGGVSHTAIGTDTETIAECWSQAMVSERWEGQLG